MTVNFFMTTSCTSCRRAKIWLENHQVEFKERNIYADPLDKEEIKALLRLCENGTEDLISTRCHIFKDFKNKINRMSLSKVIDLLVTHPELLKQPILVDDKRIEIGFHDDEIRTFLPKEVRRMQLERMLNQA